MKLTKEQYIRYSRQMILPELQGEGQEKIFQAKVLLVGLGGLGSPQALYLAAAGVGTLGLLDGDRVDLTNLQRQVVHSTDDLGSPKVISAQRRIHAINPEVEVRTHDERLTSQNAIGILSEYDIIVDCTDNFPARYLMNDACVLLGKPLVHGAIYRFEGQATVFYPAREGPCYRCLFPVPPSPGMVPSCAESGVLGVLPGVVGSIQATEVTKLILGAGRPLIGRLLFCDLLSTQFQELTIRRDPNCPVCGEEPSIRELIDYEEFCGLRAHEGEGQEGYGFQEGYGLIERPDLPYGLRVMELDQKMRAEEPLLFLDVREEWEGLLPHKDREIVVCCLFGWRSREAARLLTSKGFKDVLNLEGGLEEWTLYQEESIPKKST
jgi:molybdopterin/thiamine biosynthesis adenylyltransferase